MRGLKWVCSIAVALAFAGCNESVGPGGNTTPTRGDIIVLNSLSKTLQQFNIIDDRLVRFGTDKQLGANFDGESFDFIQDLFVTTTSAFGGSQILFGNLAGDELLITTFPGSLPTLADAGRATIILDGAANAGALVPARARNEVYLAFPGNALAQVLASDVGEFVERVIPAGDFIVSIDANLDDIGGTFAPLGPPKMTLHDNVSGDFFDSIDLDAASVGAIDAITLGDELVFLAGGGFDPVTFEAAGDGSLALINVSDRGLQVTTPLGGNGLSMEAGRNGQMYIVRTKGANTLETDVLRYNFTIRQFERGPTNPIQPLDSDGSNLSCRAVTARVTGELFCLTFEASSQGRLVRLTEDGVYVDEIAVGAGATDIGLR